VSYLSAGRKRLCSAGHSRKKEVLLLGDAVFAKLKGGDHRAHFIEERKKRVENRPMGAKKTKKRGKIGEGGGGPIVASLPKGGGVQIYHWGKRSVAPLGEKKAIRSLIKSAERKRNLNKGKP